MAVLSLCMILYSSHFLEIYEGLDSKVITKDGKYYLIPATSSGTDFPTDGKGQSMYMYTLFFVC